MNGELATGHGQLLEALTRARRRLLGLAALEVLALAALGTALIGALASFGAWLWQDGPPTAWRLALLVLLLAGWLVALALGCVRSARRGLSDRPLARRVGQLSPDLDSDALSVLELYPELARQRGPARALVAALVARVGQQARALDPGRLFPAQRARRYGIGAATGLALYLVAALLSPASPAAVWAGIWRPLAPAPTAAAADLSALLGDFEITQRYPAYTGLEPRTVSGADGDMLVPAGTRVRLVARSVRPLARAQIRLPDGQRQGLVLGNQGERLEAEFVALQSGSYRLFAEDSTGQRYAESRGHRLELVPDHAPKIDIIEPGTDLEIRDTGRVEIRYQATDDYGVGRVALVYRREGVEGAGPEQRLDLASYERAPRRVAGARPFELGGIELRPGDRIRYFLEAYDEDSLHGPKVGVSVTREIKVFSPRERHGTFLADQDRVWEAAIKLLGDVLEGGLDVKPDAPLPDPAAPMAMVGRVQALHAEVEALVATQRDDPLRDDVAMRTWEGFGHKLHWLARSGARTLGQALGSGAALARRYLGFLRQLDPELEKQVLALAAALDRQRYDQALASAEGLAQTKDRIKELMQRLAEEGDPELRRQILEELARLKRRLAAVMAEMARTARGIADEFINPDALEARDMMSMLGQIEQALNNGELEAAMQMLDDFSRQLDSTLAELEAGRATLADAKYGELFQKMDKMADEIAALEGEERELGQRLDDLLDEYRKQSESEVGRRGQAARQRLEQMAQQLLEDVSRLAGQAGDEAAYSLSSARERAALLQAQLSVDELQSAEETAGATAGDLNSVAVELDRQARLAARHGPEQADEAVRLEHLGQSARLGSELAQQIASLLAEIQPRPPSQVLSKKQRRQAQQLRQGQAEAGRQCQGLGQRLSEALSEVPGVGREPVQELGQAGLEMRSAEQDLEGLGLRPARGSMERAVDRLAKARSAMEQMRQAMKSGARSGGRVGQRRDRFERVAIPKPEDYRVPKEFREDLLEAMKRPAPEAYEEQVKRYYEELVK